MTFAEFIQRLRLQVVDAVVLWWWSKLAAEHSGLQYVVTGDPSDLRRCFSLQETVRDCHFPLLPWEPSDAHQCFRHEHGHFWSACLQQGRHLVFFSNFVSYVYRFATFCTALIISCSTHLKFRYIFYSPLL